MAVADLSGVEFSEEERFEFMEELKHVARSRMGMLGDEFAPEEDERMTALLRSLDDLQEQVAHGEAIRFSPILQVIPLSADLFSGLELKAPPYLANLMQRNDFFLVNIPITLFPKPGWGFTHLELGLRMNPGQPPDRLPVAYQIFPDQKWEVVAQASQYLNVGLDEHFRFKTPEISGELTKASLDAGVGLDASAGATLVLGPFNYVVRRPKIQTAGEGDVEVRWRLEGAAHFQEEQVKMGLVLQVPKEVSRVDLASAMEVSKSFRTFSDEVKYLIRHLRERSQNFFKRGAPIQKSHAWVDILAGL